MDITTANLLLYAKTYCLRADEESLAGKRLSAVVAIMHIYDAIDLCLTAIANDNSIPQDANDLWEAVNNHFKSVTPPKLLPLEQEVNFIRSTGDKIRHHAYMPPMRDMDRCIAKGRMFLESVFQGYFGIKFASFSLSDLVESDPVRILLLDAEQHIERREGQEALVCVESALNLARQPQDVVADTDIMRELHNALDIYKLLPVKIDEKFMQNIAFIQMVSGDSIIDRAEFEAAMLATKMALLRSVEATLYNATALILEWQAAGKVG